MEPIPATAPKPFCFVLMPFSPACDDVYTFGIKGSCDAAGAYCERVDEQIFEERILDRIYNQIAKADFIIADMTGRNANVFYEVGYAHALNKPTILLTQRADGIPFDLKHFPHIVYEQKLTNLREQLTRRVKWHVANPTSNAVQSRIDIELYLGKQNLAAGNVEYSFPHDRSPAPTITVHNNSERTFESGSFRIGVMTGDLYDGCEDVIDYRTPIPTVALPHGGFLHMLPDFPTLFPQAYASYGFELRSWGNVSTEVSEKHDIVLRVFTPFGTRDFNLGLRRLQKSSEAAGNT